MISLFHLEKQSFFEFEPINNISEVFYGQLQNINLLVQQSINSWRTIFIFRFLETYLSCNRLEISPWKYSNRLAGVRGYIWIDRHLVINAAIGLTSYISLYPEIWFWRIWLKIPTWCQASQALFLHYHDLILLEDTHVWVKEKQKQHQRRYSVRITLRAKCVHNRREYKDLVSS